MAASSVNITIAENLAQIRNRIVASYQNASVEVRSKNVPRLVAVSKTKPKEMIIAAYEQGQRHFGENYIQELVEKSNDPDILEKCPDIKWHFIGNCQTNKANKVVRCPRLSVIETVYTEKLADKLQNQWSSLKKQEPLKIMIQVNTSGEENKNGVSPSATPQLAGHIRSKCPDLEPIGLMTIGALGHSVAVEHTGENPDFMTLIECRRRVAEEMGVEERELELSMGMSNDFEEAVRMGSSSVRVGSSIFGARDYGVKDVAKDYGVKDVAKDYGVKDVAKALEEVNINAEK